MNSQNLHTVTTAIPNQRKTARIKMEIPIQVTGHESVDHKWQEMSRIIDVSRVGVCFEIQHKVSPGLVLYLSFPMPWKLRQFGHSEPSYKIYGLVKNCQTTNKSTHRVGVQFLGQTPPKTYVAKPWILFNSTEWKGSERRRALRKTVQELVWIEYYKGENELIGLEQGCTENVSRTGARICVQEPPVDFDSIRVFKLGNEFDSRAQVANQFIGKDGLHRLCVHFTQQQWV